jgi:hypothetical protein
MPIRPELRKFYGREWQTVTRPRILKRAGDKCEQCGVPNHKTVLRAFGWWTEATIEATVFAMGGSLNGNALISLPWRHSGGVEQTACFLAASCHWVGIVLTVAHLNHVAGDDRDENLKAMCQWCHLDYDKDHHHQTRAARKDAARPLLST